MQNFARVFSAQSVLLEGRIISIEVDINKKAVQAEVNIVGLPDKAVSESKDRVSAAIKNSGFNSPKNSRQKTTVSLAPASVKKEGPLFDLGIALSYLLADEETDFDFDPAGKIFIGELSLDGGLRKVAGVLPLVLEAKKRGFKEIYLPKENTLEAGLVRDIKIYGAENLNDVIKHLDQRVKDFEIKPSPETRIAKSKSRAADDILFSDIRGHKTVKRGLEIAAAGGHNVAMSGPAGTGKTMLARAFAGILPTLSYDEILEVTSIYSISGNLDRLVLRPPFRSPHHTSSHISIVGGGVVPRPGEITLSHKGVLFLDEFPEFDKRVIESLRQPLEDRVVSISRARGKAVFPANFMLVAAMNPCPCGNYGTDKICNCSASAIERYRRKLSGPIIDRIDIWLEVPRIKHRELLEKRAGNTDEDERARERVLNARGRQAERLRGTKRKSNAEMSARDIENFIRLSERSKDILESSSERMGLSPRSFHKVIKTARTIADLDERDEVEDKDILEALQYRPKLNY